MKNIRTLSLGIFSALLFVSAFAASARADADDLRDSRVISARAGRVNFVAGDVRLRRAGSTEWSALTATDELKSGDTVATGAGGRVEVLLNPGSYFRAGAGTEFTLAEAELNNLRVELARGGAVVEAIGYRDTELSITIATPRSTVSIVRTGVYRVNALADGGAEVGILQGRALVDGTLVKGGKLARASASGVEVSKLDKKNRDELDIWSRERGRELARANERLQRRNVNSAFSQASIGRFPHITGSGFWFYNDLTLCFTFLPFGYGWRSPYGYWYETGIIIYTSLPGGGYWSPNGSPGWNTPGTNGGGGSTGGTFTGGGGGSGSGGGSVGAPSSPSGSVTDRTPSAPRYEKSDGPRAGDRP